MEILNQKIDQLNDEVKDFSIMKTFEEKTGVKPVFLVLALSGIMILMVFSGFLSQFLANVIGFAYPAYKSIKSLESPQTGDDRQWLTYWTVYGLFVIFDDWSDFITSYIPYYFMMKLIFLIWLFSPTSKGAIFLYNTVIKSLFTKYSSKLDKIITKIVGESKQLAEEIKDKATDPTNLSKLIGAASKVKEFTDIKTAGKRD